MIIYNKHHILSCTAMHCKSDHSSSTAILTSCGLGDGGRGDHMEEDEKMYQGGKLHKGEVTVGRIDHEPRIYIKIKLPVIRQSR